MILGWCKRTKTLIFVYWTFATTDAIYETHGVNTRPEVNLGQWVSTQTILWAVYLENVGGDEGRYVLKEIDFSNIGKIRKIAVQKERN